MKDKLANLIFQLNDLLGAVGKDATYDWADDYIIAVYEGDEVACEFLAGSAPDWMPGFPRDATLGDWRDHDGHADQYWNTKTIKSFPRMGVVRLRSGRIMTEADVYRDGARSLYPHGSNGEDDVVAYRPIIWRGKEM